MPSRLTPRLSLRYSQAVDVLMSACDIDPSARTAFEARIRQLQRLNVARRDDSRPAGPAEYGITELAALATAVWLMAAFMVPSFAARYVIEQWATLAPALLAGARATLPEDYVAHRPLGEETIILIEASALADLGQQERHDKRYVGPLGKIVVVGQPGLSDAVREAGGAGLVVDTTIFMPTIIEAFAVSSLATGQELAHELDRLRFQT